MRAEIYTYIYILYFQPKFLGKLGSEIGFTKKAPPIGGSFGAVSESLHLLRPA